MMIRTGIVLVVALLVGGCQHKANDNEHSHAHADHSVKAVEKGPVAELEKQVLATHDSVMPLISDLLRLKKAVSAQAEKETDEAAKKRGISLKAELEEADQQMMNWMQQYNGDTLNRLDQAGALSYLKSQQTKVNAVRDKMRKSITQAEQYLD